MAHITLRSLLVLLMIGSLTQAQTISSFTLIDPVTDQVVRILSEGDTIFTHQLPSINVRADVSGTVGSVRFWLDGDETRTEGTAPYAMWGDNSGDYNAFTPSPGTYELRAVAYAGGNASGSASPEFIRNIVVSNAPEVPITPPTSPGTGAVSISGDLQKWHKITLSFDGPAYSEEDTGPNPFLDYRMDVTFSQGNRSIVVPGYFAADGNADETGANAGNVWRVHFRPDTEGIWDFEVSFRLGYSVAVSEDANAGSPLAPLDGLSGGLSIGATDKSGRDLRGKGQLRYVGKRYLQFAETGEYFLKAGPDSPENFLAYEGFDNTPTQGNKGSIHSFSPHIQHWQNGDPTWQGGKGKGIIGALNYLADQGMNAISMLLYSRNGDDDRVYPYTDRSTYAHFDCSKLDQWEIVLDHAEKQGMYLHFKLSETENDQDHDGGNLGESRKLYYREMIARFGHHLALNWNIAEEISLTQNQIDAALSYFEEHDPYQQHRVFHTFPGQKDNKYAPFLGDPALTGASLQINPQSEGPFYEVMREWIDRSAESGHPWVVACDEQGPANQGVPADNGPNDLHDFERKELLWAGLMVGGAGVEIYSGNSDQDLEDYASRENFWELCDLALDFFREQQIPFWNMQNIDEIVGDGFCLAGKTDDNRPHYVIYLPDGGTTELDIKGNVQANYQVHWFNPRQGGALQMGSVTAISDSGRVNIGTPPSDPGEDWVVWISSSDAVAGDPGDPNADPEPDEDCVYLMDNGLLVIEMESAVLTEDWKRENARAGASEDEYIVWTGNQYFNQRGNGRVVYKVQVSEAGTYRFQWRVAVLMGTDGTEHNDTWLKIEADDFYGKKANGSIVHPKPQCNQTNDCPAGSSGDGFFKVYNGSVSGWSWGGSTSDHDAHGIYARFDNPGIYEIEINARSSFHGIDRMVLWKENSISQSTATNLNNPPSAIDCSGITSVLPVPDLSAKAYFAQNWLNLEVTSTGTTTYELMNVQGQQLLKGHFDSFSKHVQQDLPAGIYVVRLQQNGRVFTQKLLKRP